MIENCPSYILGLFGATVLLTIYWFYCACKSNVFLVFIAGWVIVQSVLGLLGIYTVATTIPPRIFLFGVLPMLLFMAFLFNNTRGKIFIDSIDLKTLTWFHSIRIPVEIALLLLYYAGLVSIYMTFTGSNFDILSGLTAGVVAYIAFRSSKVNKRLLFWWNVICLILLFNVVITAILALPTPFQLLAHDQPNIAVLYFPFNLLPTVIVPLVLFSHLVAFRRLKMDD